MSSSNNSLPNNKPTSTTTANVAPGRYGNLKNNTAQVKNAKLKTRSWLKPLIAKSDAKKPNEKSVVSGVSKSLYRSRPVHNLTNSPIFPSKKQQSLQEISQKLQELAIIKGTTNLVSPKSSVVVSPDSSHSENANEGSTSTARKKGSTQARLRSLLQRKKSEDLTKPESPSMLTVQISTPRGHVITPIPVFTHPTETVKNSSSGTAVNSTNNNSNGENSVVTLDVTPLISNSTTPNSLTISSSSKSGNSGAEKVTQSQPSSPIRKR